MNISFSGEFSYEVLVAPYAYYLFCEGKLGRTHCVEGTHALYYFSKNHKASIVRRHDPPRTPIPGKNKTLYCKDLDFSEWKLPPYKERFSNEIFVFEKPMFIVHNKYAGQGKKGNQKITPDHIDLPTLKKIFDLLKDKYQIVYIRPTGSAKGYVNDKNKIVAFDDYEMIEKDYPEIVTMNALLEKYDYDYNTLQMMLLANCENSVSASTGVTLLACLFGGKHVVFEKSDGYLRTSGSYDDDGYVRKFSGTDIKCAKEYGEFINMIEEMFL